MGAASGVLGGVLLLSGLQLALSSQSATAAYGQLATAPAGWLEKFMDPGTPMIPDHSTSAPAAASSSAAAMPAPSSLPPVSTPTTLSV